jgi:hypothetical protein
MLEFWSARNRSITVGAAKNPCRVESEPALPRLWRERHQNPDPAHALALLCARCERPSRRADAEQRDELARFIRSPRRRVAGRTRGLLA